jgi:flagellar motor switch protein FliN/FliY
LSTLDKVSLDISVVLGTSVMPIHQVLRLGRGAIIELDATEADEVKINGNRIAIEVKDMLPRSPEGR